MTEYFEPSSKIVRRGRGMAQKSLDLIEAMYVAAEAAQPITGRGIGYKLFTAGLIPSMATSEMQRVYQPLALVKPLAGRAAPNSERPSDGWMTKYPFNERGSCCQHGPASSTHLRTEE